MSQGTFKLCLLFASWKWLRNHNSSLLTLQRKATVGAGSSSVVLVSGGHWNKLQLSLVMCKWQCQVKQIQNLHPNLEDAAAGASALDTCTLACFYSGEATKCSVPGAQMTVSYHLASHRCRCHLDRLWQELPNKTSESGTGYSNCHAT